NSLVRASIDARTYYALLNDNASQKLQVVLEIAQELGHNLDESSLLNHLADHLLRLFPQSDRALVLLCRGTQLTAQATRSRLRNSTADSQYSKTIVHRALEEGIGLLSEDVGNDGTFKPSSTMLSLKLRSFLCVPLIGREQRRLGVIQLDCSRP